MKVGVLGAGCVGLITASALASMGHKVICVGRRAENVNRLNKGIPSFFEPGLAELIKVGREKGLLTFTTEIGESISGVSAVIVCVETAELCDGSTDATRVKEAVASTAPLLEDYVVIVVRSAVTPGTCSELKSLISRCTEADFDLVYNPEFLREGTAVADMLRQYRIVVGVETEKSLGIMRDLYRKFNSPWYVTSLIDAEMIRIASNSFLALKISYINELSRICDRLGADIKEVAAGIGLDPRIGPHFLEAGLGFGGPVLPRDLHSLLSTGKKVQCDLKLLQRVDEINREQPQILVEKMKRAVGGLKGELVAFWGLSYKPLTSDLRASQALVLASKLQEEGAVIFAYDPGISKAGLNVNRGIELRSSLYEVLEGASALVIATDWEEFKNPDWDLVKRNLKKRVVVDCRNIFDHPEDLENLGFEVLGFGRRGR